MHSLEKWDKISDINGISANTVLKSLNNPTEVYLIKDNDEVLYIQADTDCNYRGEDFKKYVAGILNQLNSNTPSLKYLRKE